MEGIRASARVYAALVSPGIHHTMGGVTIYPSAEVQSKTGKSIPGLFATGEVTGGVHGGNRIGGSDLRSHYRHERCLLFAR